MQFQKALRASLAASFSHAMYLIHSKYFAFTVKIDPESTISHHLYPKLSGLCVSVSKPTSMAFQQCSQGNSIKICHNKSISCSKQCNSYLSLGVNPNSYSGHLSLFGSPITPPPTSLTHLSLPAKTGRDLDGTRFHHASQNDV